MKVLICPYCGGTQLAGERCRVCGGLFEPLSRQATHNGMGPWFIRDEDRPFGPGASYETLVKLIERGQVTKYSIIRSPTTKQFWTVAKRVAGVAHLLGYCHNCDASVDPADHGCHACGVPFGAYLDRNFLGLPEIRPLPWELGADDSGRPAEPPPRILKFERVPEPVGISSFASDEELRSSGLNPMPAQPLAVAERPAASSAWPQAAYEPSAAPLIPREELSDSTTARATQRRVQRQEQTIRLLVVALVISVVLAVVCLAAVLAAKTRPETTPTTAEPASEPKPPAAEQTRSSSEPKEAGGLSAVTTSPAGPEPQEALPPNRDYREDIAHADELLVAARLAERPAADRTRDYEEALKILRDTQAHAPGDVQPADLAERIAAAERELERLKLQEFFP